MCRARVDNQLLWSSHTGKCWICNFSAVQRNSDHELEHATLLCGLYHLYSLADASHNIPGTVAEVATLFLDSTYAHVGNISATELRSAGVNPFQDTLWSINVKLADDYAHFWWCFLHSWFCTNPCLLVKRCSCLTYFTPYWVRLYSSSTEH